MKISKCNNIATHFVIIITICIVNGILVFIHQPKALYDTIWKLTTFTYNVGHVLYWPCILYYTYPLRETWKNDIKT